MPIAIVRIDSEWVASKTRFRAHKLPAVSHVAMDVRISLQLVSRWPFVATWIRGSPIRAILEFIHP
jgi:hypothetical protein